MAQHFLRSMEHYDHEFAFRVKTIEENGEVSYKLKQDPTTGEPMKWVLKGRGHKNKNISIIENDEDFEDLMSYEQIKQLIKRNVVTEIAEIPRTYYDAMEIASQRAQELLASRVEKTRLENELAIKDTEIETLKQKMRDAGLEG